MSLLFKDFRAVIGRKRHLCEACFGPIAAGEFHYQANGMYESNGDNWRMHEECFEIFKANGYEVRDGGSFEIPERVRLAEAAKAAEVK